MRQFWAIGAVAAFRIKHLDELGFAPFAPVKYNMYDFPAEVQLINKWAVPMIPSTTQMVNKDVVLGWAQANHKPVKMIVDFYIDRITLVEMVLNTNLHIHKMPFMVGITPTDAAQAEDIINRILNNELVIFAEMEELNMVKNFATASNYIIDKLYSYKTSLENELLTFLGIDNAMEDSTKDRLILDQVNANNALINMNQEGLMDCLNDFCEQIGEVLGITVSVKPAIEKTVSVHEDINDGGDENDETVLK